MRICYSHVHWVWYNDVIHREFSEFSNEGEVIFYPLLSHFHVFYLYNL